jgi:hypothetical protein
VAGKPEIEIDRISTLSGFLVDRVIYPQYPYDPFLFIRLPDNRVFVYREESYGWCVAELKHDGTGDFIEKSFKTVDEGVGGRLFRLKEEETR